MKAKKSLIFMMKESPAIKAQLKSLKEKTEEIAHVKAGESAEELP